MSRAGSEGPLKNGAEGRRGAVLVQGGCTAGQRLWREREWAMPALGTGVLGRGSINWGPCACSGCPRMGRWECQPRSPDQAGPPGPWLGLVWPWVRGEATRRGWQTLWVHSCFEPSLGAEVGEAQVDCFCYCHCCSFASFLPGRTKCLPSSQNRYVMGRSKHVIKFPRDTITWWRPVFWGFLTFV